MENIRKHLLFLILILFALNPALAQNKVELALQKMDDQYPQEKIYLRFTKENFVAGEQVWLKALVFEKNTPSVISTSLHLVLYNESKQQVSKRFIPLYNGEGQTNIQLPDSLPEGIYYLRAYTEWMQNFDESFQYMRALKVYNPKSPKKLIADTNAAWTAEAYPEGGNFIEGFNTKIAVRLHSAGKLPESWSGYVIEKSKPSEQISSFQSLDPNIGFFYLIPEKNQQYELIVEDKSGRKQTIGLPQVAESGIYMQVNNGKTFIHYSIRNKNRTEPVKSCIIIGTINNTIVYKANAKIDESGIAATIPTQQAETGVLQLTLFDSSFHILAKRLCFINNSKASNLPFPLSLGSFNKSPRSQVEMNMNADTTIDHYNILVLDGNSADDTGDEDLYSNLWLSSEFPAGSIQRPASYFRKGANASALDALLISEKWLRFDWDKILNDQFPEIKFKPQTYISWRGTALANNQPAANIELNLIFKFSDSSYSFQQIQTDANGNFDLTQMEFEDKVMVYYKDNNKNSNKKNLTLKFESLNPETPYLSALPSHGYKLVPRIANEVAEPSVERALQARDNFRATEAKIQNLDPILVKGRKKTPTEILNEQLSTPMYRRNNEIVFDLVNDNKSAVNYQNILQYLSGRVAGMVVRRVGGDWIAYLRGAQANIFVNETVMDIGVVSTIPVSDIAMVKVTRGVFTGTSGGDLQSIDVGNTGAGGGGAILIYLHKGNTRPPVAGSLTGMNYSLITGFDKSAEFPNPDYNDPTQKPDKKDTRDVLYWNPYWYSSESQAEPIKFFNNDEAKSFRVILIGFPRTGGVPVLYSEILQ